MQSLTPTIPQPKYGGMFAYDKSIALNIVTANVYHAFGLRSASDIAAGLLKGFTFNAGRIVDANITSEADTGGKLRIVCSAAHGLVNGDIVTLGNMNNAGHNGVTVVLVDTTNPTTEFIANTITYVAGAGASAGVVYAPAYLEASAGSEGNYHANFIICGTASNTNKNIKWELNVGIAPADNIVTERLTTNTLATIEAAGNISVVAGNRIWVSGKNKDDTTDYTVKHFNLNLHKIS